MSREPGPAERSPGPTSSTPRSSRPRRARRGRRPSAGDRHVRPWLARRCARAGASIWERSRVRARGRVVAEDIVRARRGAPQDRRAHVGRGHRRGAPDRACADRSASSWRDPSARSPTTTSRRPSTCTPPSAWLGRGQRRRAIRGHGSSPPPSCCGRGRSACAIEPVDERPLGRRTDASRARGAPRRGDQHCAAEGWSRPPSSTRRRARRRRSDGALARARGAGAQRTPAVIRDDRPHDHHHEPRRPGQRGGATA